MIRSLGKSVRWCLEWRIQRRALEWVLMFQERKPTPRELEQLNKWLDRGLVHREAFRSTWVTVARTEEIAAKLGSDLLREDAPRPSRSSRPAWLGGGLGALTAVVLLALGVLFIRSKSDVLVYTTRTGEWRTLPLPDGSEVSINTRSRVEWKPCQRERCITFLEGEAYFSVVRNPRHPFVVLLGQDGAVSIRVIGTEFNVHRRTDRTQTDITVASGTVEVSSRSTAGIGSWTRQLQANQQLSFGPQGITAEPHPVSAVSVAAWRNGMLDIDGDLLPSAVCHLAEYLDEPVYTDDTVARYRLHARFDVRGAATALLNLDPRLVTEPYNGGYLVHERGATLDPNARIERCR